MTAKEIINEWCDTVFRERQQNKVFPNVFFDAFEADILEITKAGYAAEYEVKISRSDFKADASKKRNYHKGMGINLVKHDLLKNGDRVNRFYYIVPKSLVSAEEVPEWAGLIYARWETCRFFSHEKGHYEVERMFFSTVKTAPVLTKEKFGMEKLFKCLESTYYRFHKFRKV